MIPFNVSEIFPVVAPSGTTVVMLVEVAALTMAVTPLKATILLAGVALKFEPLIITVAASAPPDGLRVVMVGVGSTLKFVALVNVTPLTVIDIGPVLAPAGTVVAMLFVVDAVTTLATPLNATILFAGVVLKFVPLMVKGVPTAPLVGVKPVKVGEGNTVKLVALLIVTPLTNIETLPVVAPGGTVAVMLVGVDAVTIAITPLKSTSLSDGIVLKLFPVMIIEAPTAALTGLKPDIDGVGKTLKFEALSIVTPLTVTEIFPDVAPAGTVVVILLAVDEVTVAVVLLNFTTLLAGVVLKLLPLITTMAPTAPLVGVKLVMVGEGRIVKFAELVPGTPFTVTLIFPVVAPAGTVAVILVVVDAVTTAFTPLNSTSLLEGVVLKFVPVRMMEAPTAPLVGLKFVIVGVGTVKLAELVPVIPATVTEIGPVTAPTGTVAVMLEVVDAVTVAVTPLKSTILLAGVALKLEPEIVTVTP